MRTRDSAENNLKSHELILVTVRREVFKLPILQPVSNARTHRNYFTN